MGKHAKTFNANKGFKIFNCCFYSNFAVLKIQTCGILFKIICIKTKTLHENNRFILFFI